MMMLTEISHTEEDKYYIFFSQKKVLHFNPILGPETIKETLDLDWEKETERERWEI